MFSYKVLVRVAKLGPKFNLSDTF